MATHLAKAPRRSHIRSTSAIGPVSLFEGWPPQQKGSPMFTPEQYRTKAAEYTELVRTTRAPNDVRELQQLERSFTALADNEQWLSDNHDKTVHAAEHQGGAALAADEERILRCLGAALIMQWNTLPTKLRRELFDNAGSMGELLDTAALRGQIARFLHKHKDDKDEVVARPSA
jgi:hypothetical protein